MIDPWKIPRYGDVAHACRFVITPITAWRITHPPVRIAIRLRVYACGCGKTHVVELPVEVVK